jgi:hypothetical protein
MRSLVIASLIAVSAATYGVDVSSLTLPDAFSCLKNSGRDFAVIRGYQSNNVPDPEGVHTVYNAWDAGMKDVDIYFFPCPRCGDPEGQITKFVDYYKGYNIVNRGTPPHSYGMLWLDIEGPQYWMTQAENREFFEGLKAGAAAHGIVLGVYTSESQWSPIMGDYTGGSEFPLWYAHYDGDASFSDFRAFGGWSKPAIKQYRGTTSLCGASVDENYYP